MAFWPLTSSYSVERNFNNFVLHTRRNGETSYLRISGEKVKRKAAFEVYFNDICIHSKVFIKGSFFKVNPRESRFDSIS